MTFVFTRSGARMDLLAPNSTAVSARDIARALARIPRWTGHTTRPWSVAQHSLLVQTLADAYGASPMTQLAALFHDASEAYTGDISTPLKKALGPEILAIEAALMMVCETALQVPLTSTRDEWKEFDEYAKTGEALELLPLITHDFFLSESILSTPECKKVQSHLRAVEARTMNKTPDEVAELFLQTAQALWRQTGTTPPIAFYRPWQH